VKGKGSAAGALLLAWLDEIPTEAHGAYGPWKAEREQREERAEPIAEALLSVVRPPAAEEEP